MKKIILGFFVFGLLLTNANQVKASIVDDLLAQVKSLKTEISLLKGTQSASVLGASTGVVPSVMFWPGKINQYMNLDTGRWQSDPDGQGSWAHLLNDTNKLDYCKKHYPNTVSVEDYKNETIGTWMAGNNFGPYTGTKMSTKCVQSGEFVAPPNSLAQISSLSVSAITSNSATFSANILSVGTPAMSARGFCYRGYGPVSRTDNLSTCVKATGATTGVFSLNVTGLSPSTSYNYIAYADNAYGPATTTQGTFSTLATGSNNMGQSNVIHGKWTDWSNSGSCVNGWQKQIRTCTNPAPFGGGLYCTGESSKDIVCGNGDTVTTIETYRAYSVKQDSAILGVKITALVSPAPKAKLLIHYGTTPHPTSNYVTLSSQLEVTTYEYLVTGLTCGTTYYYYGSIGNVYSADKTFTTANCDGYVNPGLPVVSSPSAISISKNSATLGASVSSTSVISEYGICYKKAGENFGCVPTKTLTGGKISIPIYSLSPDTTYTFYAYAYNSFGEGKSSEITFITPKTNADVITGTSIITASNCVIKKGEKNCLSTIAWNVANPKSGTTYKVAVYEQVDSMSIIKTIGEGKTGTVTRSINPRTPVFKIIETTGTASATVTTAEPVATCEAGSAWDGFYCKLSSDPIPSITVTSPNGGETYTAGQQITVKWSTKNIIGNIAEINLIPLDMKFGTGITFDKQIPNIGSYIAKLPTIVDGQNNYYSFGKNFKIEVIAWDSERNIIISDYSDNPFTITSSNEENPLINERNTCTPGQSFNPMSGFKCLKYIMEGGCLPGHLFNPLTGKLCSSVSQTELNKLKDYVQTNQNNLSDNKKNINQSTCYSNVITEKLGIKLRSKGSQVKILQEILNSLGYLPDDGIDSRFGPTTAGAVMEYQEDNRLDKDGIVGANTMAHLNKAWQDKCVSMLSN